MSSSNHSALSDQGAPQDELELRAPSIREALLVLEGMQEGALVVADGCVTGANPALLRMCGKTHEDVVGMSLDDLFSDPEGLSLESFGTSDAVRLASPDGGRIPVSLRPVTEQIFLVIDRSRERRLEQEVWRLARTDEPIPGSAFSGEAANSVEHEIGTAATVVRGNLRMLLSQRVGNLTEKQAGLLRAAEREIERVTSLTQKLMRLALPDAGPADAPVRKPVQLQPLIEGVMGRCRALFEERGMTLEAEFEHQIDLVSVDPEGIEQILYNLLQNASKFGPEDSQVTVAVDEIEAGDGAASRSVCISVVDRGPGVLPEEAEKIFEPFARGALTRERSISGVGLGLAVSRRIAVAHGGCLEAVAGGEGGHFRLVLPAGAGD